MNNKKRVTKRDEGREREKTSREAKCDGVLLMDPAVGVPVPSFLTSHHPFGLATLPSSMAQTASQDISADNRQAAKEKVVFMRGRQGPGPIEAEVGVLIPADGRASEGGEADRRRGHLEEGIVLIFFLREEKGEFYTTHPPTPCLLESPAK